MNKLPRITLAFGVMKICATTLGETVGDLVSMTLKVGYALSSVTFIGLFNVTLLGQLAVRRYHPPPYWTVILAASVAGASLSDFVDRTLGLGYAAGSAILLSLFGLWYLSEKSLSVNDITRRRAELFYWLALLFSDTLGTLLGDYLADDSGLDFAGGALLIGSLIALMAILQSITWLSSVLIFWAAFVLTRPFGATLGAVLTKPRDHGDLNFGTAGSSRASLSTLFVVVIYALARNRRTELQTRTSILTDRNDETTYYPGPDAELERRLRLVVALIIPATEACAP